LVRKVWNTGGIFPTGGANAHQLNS